MRRLVFLLVVAFSGCLPSTKVGWYQQPGLRSSSVCSWKDARWHDNGVLLAPGTGLPMARARTVWGSKSQWRGATVTGGLRRAGPHFLFDGTWRGDGIILDADVDASEGAMLSALTTVAAGPVAVLPRGAELWVVRAEARRLTVTVPDEAMDVFVPLERPLAEVSCEALTLYPQHVDALEWAGFDKAAPRALLSLDAEVALATAPGGARVGVFKARKAPLPVRRLEQRGDQVRVAYVHLTGVVWHGWVAASALRDEPEKDLADVFGMGGLLGNLVGEEPGWVACAVEQKLYAQLAGRVEHVGRVVAATPFKPGPVEGAYVPVDFRNSWLTPEEGVRFLLGAEAAACGPWIAPAPPQPKPPKPPLPNTL